MSTASTQTQTDLPTEESSIEERIEATAHPWRDHEILEELYLTRELTMEECADQLDCSPPTILKWLRRHDIETREPCRHSRHPSKSMTPDGYQLFISNREDGTNTIRVSQLTAIADGADPHEVFTDGIHVHHRNKIPWDDRPDNLEVLHQTEHREVHIDETWTVEQNFPVLTR